MREGNGRKGEKWMTVTFIATVKNMLLILAQLPKASVKKTPAYLSEVPVPPGYKS